MSNGAYSFLNLNAGTYDVRQIDRSGWVQTAPAGGFQTLTLDGATNATNIDFGNRQPPGTISGTVYSDYSADGTQNAQEPGLVGWTVYLDDNNNGTLDGGERSTVSGADGSYSFENLIPGNYNVREVIQPGYVQTVPGSGGVILGSGGAAAGAGHAAGDAHLDSTLTHFSQTEIVVAFKGNFGRGVLREKIQADARLRSFVDYGASSDLATVRGVTLVEVNLRPGADPQKAVDAFTGLDKVQWAQVNYVYDTDPRELTPNDPSYPQQYHHPLMQNNIAWDTTLGNPRIIIAITDDAEDYEHQDLYLNFWVNPAEIPATRLANLTDINGDGYISMDELNDPSNQGPFKANDVNSDGHISGSDLLANMVKDGNGNDTGAGGWSDGIDQGGNGFADDIVGRDVWSNDNSTLPPTSSDSHGTHVTGIAAARTGNGIGVAGVAGRVTIMPIRFYGGSGWTSTHVLNAYKYASDNGANIISTSYNVDGFANDNTFKAALNYLYDHGVLHFNSAGNNSELNPVRQNFDQSLYVISTGASDQKSSFSNWGWGSDISAPGENILSTYPNNSYASISGTSMATPNAAGVAALIWSAHPTWTREQVAAQLIGSADNIDAQNPSSAGLLGGGRVNSNKALNTTIAPPRLKTLAGLPAEGGSTLTPPGAFTLDVANVFDPASITLSSFTMRGDGLDDVFGTADDTTIPMTLNFGGQHASTFMVGTNRLNFAVSGAMPADTYRFTMLPTATDPFGQALDGNGDGTGGDAFTRTFTIALLTDPYHVNLAADEVVANAHFGNHDNRTPRVLASSFTFATAQQLNVQFSENVFDSTRWRRSDAAQHDDELAGGRFRLHLRVRHQHEHGPVRR